MYALGDRASGKSTLCARLQKLDITDPPRGLALDYSFLDIEDNEGMQITAALQLIHLHLAQKLLGGLIYGQWKAKLILVNYSRLR